MSSLDTAFLIGVGTPFMLMIYLQLIYPEYNLKFAIPMIANWSPFKAMEDLSGQLKVEVCIK